MGLDIKTIYLGLLTKQEFGVNINDYIKSGNQIIFYNKMHLWALKIGVESDYIWSMWF